MKQGKVLIAMPAFNEGKVIAKVISDIKKEGFKDILVVDDHSKDDTLSKAQKSGAIVLRHPINRGAGAASATAIEYAKVNKYDFLVLIDSDGQHLPSDIKKLLKFSSRYDVVIGSRLISNVRDMPISRRILNFGGSLITFVFFGLFVYDSQSGFKVFNKKALNSIKITFDKYEFCSEVIGEIYRNHLSYKEVPIKVVYSDHSLGKGHGQSFMNGLKMIFRMIFRF